MEIKEIRHHYVFLEDKATSFGFKKDNDIYIYSHDSINKDMKFLFEYKGNSLFLTCIDKNFNDTFLPFEGNGIKGDFVTSLRKEANSLLDIIKKSCFEHINIEKEDGKIMNIKIDTNLISSIIDNKNIFPAYHMSKKHWISIYLDKHINIDKIKALLDLSYSLVV